MSIENKQAQLQPAENEQTVVDDLLTVINVEDREALMHEERIEAFNRFKAGEISRSEYNALVQTGAAYGESEEQIQKEKKKAALDRINGDSQPQRFGQRVVNLLRRK